MCYILWFDSEKPPPQFWRHDAIHVAKTTQQARKIIETYGFPLIISFGPNSLKFVRELKKYDIPESFTYRIHCEHQKNEIVLIMETIREKRINARIEYQYSTTSRRACMGT